MRAHTCECRNLWRPEVSDALGSEVTGGFELPDVDAGK